MTERPLSYTHARDRGNLNVERHVMAIHDLRHATSKPTLEKEGVILADLPLDVGNETDPDIIAAVYHPRLERLMRHITGAPKIVLMHCVLRWSPRARNPQQTTFSAATLAHCDYDRESFHAQMRNVLANDPEREYWLSGRYAVYNTWRVLSPPPQDMPLGLLDRTSIAAGDFMAGTVIAGEGPNAPRYTQNMVRYNPSHRWVYCANMSLNDTLIFLGFDSVQDDLPGNPHAAFEDTSIGNKGVPRISCDTRVCVFWGL
jgi:hypothetical protein